MWEGGLFDFRDPDEEPSSGPVIDTDYQKTVTEHVERALGPTAPGVIHEIVSPHVHLDVLTVPNCLGSDCTALVTCGMGLRAMNTPPAQKRHARMELALCLPPDWPALFAGPPLHSRTPNNMAADSAHGLGPGAWIIPGLQFTARLPFQFGTWYGEGHTIPNGDPPEPICQGSKLCCSLIAKPKRLGRFLHHLALPSGEDVYFWTLIFITVEEMNYKLRRGAKELFKKLSENGVDELLRLDRASVCKGGLRGWFE